MLNNKSAPARDSRTVERQNIDGPSLRPIEHQHVPGVDRPGSVDAFEQLSLPATSIAITPHISSDPVPLTEEKLRLAAELQCEVRLDYENRSHFTEGDLIICSSKNLWLNNHRSYEIEVNGKERLKDIGWHSNSTPLTQRLSREGVACISLTEKGQEQLAHGLQARARFERWKDEAAGK